MAPKILLLISAIVAVSAFVVLVVVNDARRSTRVRRSAGSSRQDFMSRFRALDGVERIDYGIAFGAATALVVLIGGGLPSLESYLSFILFLAVLVSALACAFDRRDMQERRRRQRRYGNVSSRA